MIIINLLPFPSTNVIIFNFILVVLLAALVGYGFMKLRKVRPPEGTARNPSGANKDELFK